MIATCSLTIYLLLGFVGTKDNYFAGIRRINGAIRQSSKAGVTLECTVSYCLSSSTASTNNYVLLTLSVLLLMPSDLRLCSRCLVNKEGSPRICLSMLFNVVLFFLL